MLAEAFPPARLAFAPYALVLADAPSPALLAFAPPALVLAEALPPAVLAKAPLALMLTNALPPAILACAPSALMLADALSTALLALVSSAVVRAPHRPQPGCTCVSETHHRRAAGKEAHKEHDPRACASLKPGQRHAVQPQSFPRVRERLTLSVLKALTVVALMARDT